MIACARYGHRQLHARLCVSVLLAYSSASSDTMQLAVVGTDSKHCVAGKGQGRGIGRGTAQAKESVSVILPYKKTTGNVAAPVLTLTCCAA